MDLPHALETHRCQHTPGILTLEDPMPQLKKGAVADTSRTVPLEGGRPTEGFAANDIKTAKYNVSSNMVAVYQ